MPAMAPMSTSQGQHLLRAIFARHLLDFRNQVGNQGCFVHLEFRPP